MPRYVILRHELPRGHARPTHWDLMLEWGTALRTWALAAEPAPHVIIEAEPLADHRLAYLDYEGPVSQDRGTVSRWDAGSYRLESEADCMLRLALCGARLRGTLAIQAAGHFWTVSFSADPTTA